MKTLQVSDENFKLMKTLYNEFYEIYGNKDTEWNLTDLDEMRLIGQEFMEILSDHLVK